MSGPTVPPGWYDDPDEESQLRYWDGSGWTSAFAARKVTAEAAARHQATSPADDNSSPRRGPPPWTLLAVASAIVAVGAWFRFGPPSQSTDDGEGTAEIEAANQPPTLAERTDKLADELTDAICPGAICVDSSTEGVVSVDTRPAGEYGTEYLDGDELEEVATDLGVWSVADAKRMQETRALDGMQTSTNGAVTWTYHPDSGLDIVIDVEALPGS